MGNDIKNYSGGVMRAVDISALQLGKWAQSERPVRVLLIQPPTGGGVRSLLPQLEEGSEGIGFKPPLGLLYIATMVKEKSPHEVKVIDAIAQRLDFAGVLQEVQDFMPDIVGISAWTDWWFPAYQVGKLIKEALPGVHLCYGGPHVGIYPQETLEVSFVDSVIVGDGEVPFLYLCNMIAAGVVDNIIPGLHFKQFGIKGGDSTFYIHKELDSLPIPDRSLLPVDIYSSVLGKGNLITTMITSRGCPNRCTFCKLNFQKALFRSADNVVDEFQRIHDLGIHEVEIYDDTFTWSKSRVIEICSELTRRNLRMRWAVRDRVNNARVDLLEAMSGAGCSRIHYGIESGVDRVIDIMKKNITTREARRAVSLARGANMTVLTYFMFGNIGETKDDMRRTIAFALELDADYSEFSITIPYAGTEMYDYAIKNGLIARDYWLDYARNPTADFFPPQLIEEFATLPELIGLCGEAVRRFYFRPKYLMRQLRDVASMGELLRKATMGARLFNSVYVK
jgi:radical SAM superfamily enzyme YgiQ (UPF0313 family)